MISDEGLEAAVEELAETIRGVDGPATLGGMEVAEALYAAGYRRVAA